jgi:hypothetical protein
VDIWVVDGSLQAASDTVDVLILCGEVDQLITSRTVEVDETNQKTLLSVEFWGLHLLTELILYCTEATNDVTMTTIQKLH